MSRYRGYPAHLGRPTGRGIATCDRSGFLRRTVDMITEDGGARVAREFQDYTPGFGTIHPQDVNQAETGGDPSPIENARPVTAPLSKQDLGMSDQEIEAAVRENRPPRRGF